MLEEEEKEEEEEDDKGICGFCVLLAVHFTYLESLTLHIRRAGCVSEKAYNDYILSCYWVKWACWCYPLCILRVYQLQL